MILEQTMRTSTGLPNVFKRGVLTARFQVTVTVSHKDQSHQTFLLSAFCCPLISRFMVGTDTRGMWMMCASSEPLKMRCAGV